MFVNTKLLKLTGYSAKEVVGQNVQKLMPADVAKVVHFVSFHFFFCFVSDTLLFSASRELRQQLPVNRSGQSDRKRCWRFSLFFLPGLNLLQVGKCRLCAKTAQPSTAGCR